MSAARVSSRPVRLLSAVLVCAGAALAWTDAGAQADDARGWWSRLQDAALHGNYQGTLVFSSGYSVSSSRVAFFRDGQDQYERIEWLDGERRRTYRRNDEVTTIWPRSRTVVVERRDRLAMFPALLQSRDVRIEDHYVLTVLGVERVAGHDAQVLMVRPKDASRFGQKWWAERSSGLLLRADILGEGGRVLESAAFSDVVIGVRPQIDLLNAEMKRRSGWKVVRPTVTTTLLESEGWRLVSEVPGFRRVQCVRREPDPADPLGRVAVGRTLQAIYSDGLTHVSLFIEPARPAERAPPMAASVGATHTVMHDMDGYRVTVVGDVPYATLQGFVSRLERLR